MSLFVMSLGLGGDEDVNDWYDRIPPKGISSLLQLVEAICNKWNPNVEKEMREIITSLLDKEDHVDIVE